MTEPRLPTAQWIFERQLAWIAAAEAKTAVVVAIDTAMLAALATAFASADRPGAWAIVMSTMSVSGIAIGVACCAISLIPRTSGPPASLLFFGTIAKARADDYSHALETASDSSLLKDFSTQIHRNAEIAARKHLWIRRALGWSFFAALPWLVAIALLVRH